MLATIIILAIIVAIAIVIFAIKAANIKNAIEDIYAKQAILHDKYRVHEDIINANYKSIAELNRRQDELAEAAHESDAALRGATKDLQDYNAERERKAKEAVEEYCIVEIARKRSKKAAKATEKAQAPDTPATDPRETRDAKQTAAANRARFAELRNTLSVREAAKELGVSLTTAKRYEQWRKAQEQ